MTANKKNRRENGMRAVFLGSNPHSKGEHFSRSSDERNAIIRAIVITIIGKIIAIDKDKRDKSIPQK